MTATAATTYDPQSDPVVRSLLTIGALIVLFTGSHIPLPGLSSDQLQRIFAHRVAPSVVSIFALGVTPIIFARAILELCRLAIPPVARWAAKPDQAAQWMTLGRGVALVLAGVQAYGVALRLENAAGLGDDGGWAFRFPIVVTAIGATALLIALADLVTRKGVGDGLLVLLAAPMVARAPHDLAFLIALGRTGAISIADLLQPIALVVIAVALLVAASLVRQPGLTPLASANLDVWPPLLAASVLGPLGATLVLFLGSANLPPPPLLLLVRLIALAGLIALFAALRERAGSAQSNRAPMTAVQILVCIGAAIFALLFQMSTEAWGLGIIVVVAAVLSCFSRFVRM